MSDAYFPIERTFRHGFECFIWSVTFILNRQAVHVIMKRKELATTLLMFLKLLLRYMYLRADECIRYEKER